ncbi:MAG: hypothetical protein AAB944_02030 [Patescibacteria group bacterium]
MEIAVSQASKAPFSLFTTTPEEHGITKEYPPALASVHENVTNCPELIDVSDALYDVILGSWAEAKKGKDKKIMPVTKNFLRENIFMVIIIHELKKKNIYTYAL